MEKQLREMAETLDKVLPVLERIALALEKQAYAMECGMDDKVSYHHQNQGPAVVVSGTGC